MIPRAYIQAWSSKAPWPDLRQVEQDLIIRRALCDLFDLHHGLDQLSLDSDKLIACFEHYLALEGHPISRAMAEQRRLQKLTGSLTEDIAPLLPFGIEFTDVHAIEAFNRVWTLLISRIKGDAWKSSANAISELRTKKYPGLCPDIWTYS